MQEIRWLGHQPWTDYQKTTRLEIKQRVYSVLTFARPSGRLRKKWIDSVLQRASKTKRKQLA